MSEREKKQIFIKSSDLLFWIKENMNLCFHISINEIVEWLNHWIKEDSGSNANDLNLLIWGPQYFV